MGGDFLARILLALEGKERVVAGLQEVQNATGKLSRTQIKTIFDSRGVASGKEITETFKPLNEQVAKGKGLMADFGNAMRRALIVAPVWMIMRTALQAVFSTIQENIKFLVELETAMARIKIVGKGTDVEYKNLQKALIALSYTYGTTASEAASAAVLFAQQGRNVKETIELTRAAMLASKILGTDIKNSS
jgi:hypothetical protein